MREIMAFDPPYKSVADSFIGENPSLSFQTMQGLTERELKLSIPGNSDRVVFIQPNHDHAIQQGALKIKALFSSLDPSNIWFDPQGVIPNDYTLASLNLDTINGTLPTAQFYRNGWQCRIRAPLWVHGNEDEFCYESMLRQIDANMKTLLSDQEGDTHRIELEEIIRSHPSAFFKEFKKAVSLPDFTEEIDDRHLRISDICLTSRTGFYVVIKDPQSGCHVLLHGTYDASNFVTSNVFTRKDLRLEMELEAKGIFSTDPRLLDEKSQDAIVNRVFGVVSAAASPIGLVPHTISKLEDSMNSAHSYYREKNGNLPTFASHLDANGIIHSTTGSPSLHHLFSLSAGQRIKDFMGVLKYQGISAPLCILASEMPNPKEMLDNLVPNARQLVAA